MDSGEIRRCNAGRSVLNQAISWPVRCSITITVKNGLFVCKAAGCWTTTKAILLWVANACGDQYQFSLLPRSDVNNDRVEDVIVLGEQAAALPFCDQRAFREMTAASGLKDLKASDDLLPISISRASWTFWQCYPEEGLRVSKPRQRLFRGQHLSGLPAILPGAPCHCRTGTTRTLWRCYHSPRTAPMFFAKQQPDHSLR
jgi:hypothetical protein